jgi:hypothetical protein
LGKGGKMNGFIPEYAKTILTKLSIQELMKAQIIILSILVAAFVMLLTPTLFSQTVGDVVTAEDSTDNAYVVDFPEPYMGRVYLTNRNFSFNLKSRIGNKRSILYSPNGQFLTGAGFFYKKAGLELGFKVPVRDVLNERYGKTRFLDFQTNYYSRRIGADLTFQRYKGFYVKNPLDVVNTWIPGSNYPQRSDIRAINLSGNVYYIANYKKFSYRAVYVQTERQARSAGSFIAMASLSYLRFDSNGPLIPDETTAMFGEHTSFSNGSFYSLAILPGYAHTFVVDKFYFSFALHMGVGLQQKYYTIDDRLQQQLSLARKNNMRLAGGYYGQRFLVGTSLIIDNTPIKMQNVVLSASTFNVKLFAGYKFYSRSLDKIRKRVEDKISEYDYPGKKK